ncbi:hypothetical protein RDI58_001057 [Solanum bulbocastanum]|uniref:Uncharacterized protein n=1 Tax=Solanum bulbocastanum TaxID=147425 RepID=A0AAN8U797_SOLBU
MLPLVLDSPGCALCRVILFVYPTSLWGLFGVLLKLAHGYTFEAYGVQLVLVSYTYFFPILSILMCISFKFRSFDLYLCLFTYFILLLLLLLSRAMMPIEYLSF